MVNKNKLSKYFRIWLTMAKNAFLATMSNKTVFFIFLFGKVLRFLFFLFFLIFLIQGTGGILNYGKNEIVFFFLTFNLIDVVSQFLFREVYQFRQKIVSGRLDLTLTKPVSPLFISLFGGPDIIDLVTIPPSIFALFYVGKLLGPSALNSLYYVVLLLNGVLISMAFHIAVISLGIITLEVDHSIFIFRDLMNLGRLPVDIYREPIRSLITYLIPIGIITTLPAKVLVGMVSLQGVAGSCLLGVIFIFLSIKFWKYALRFYTSASS